MSKHQLCFLVFSLFFMTIKTFFIGIFLANRFNLSIDLPLLKST